MYEVEKIVNNGFEKRAMISLPMNGRKNEVIEADRKKAIAKLHSLGYKVVNTFFVNGEGIDASLYTVNMPVCYLGHVLEKMAECHAIYFCKGWESSRGCQIEHMVAEQYGIEMMYEEPPIAMASVE